ncbi:hypothetical protein J1N35_001098 [Gossypium stocksii]|uniref:Uncharacterized protein n=1 Tax=Gossypium stocksii TaxID=47602 RepID=A0A9D4AJA1_9ROSI|nr:hypothetical protein J1N35_001098 [Gossypium stocksii]
MEKRLIYSAWLYGHRPCTKGRTTCTCHCDKHPNAKRDFENWDRSNCMSLIIMSTTFQKPLGVQNLKRLVRSRVSLMKLRNFLPKMILLK